MKKIFTLFAIALTLTAAGQFSNRRAPGFSLTDSHYRQHDPQDYRGKVLLVDIMQTGCGTCIKLVDVLSQLKAKYGEKLGIISVVTMPDTFSTAEAFIAAHKLSWPMVFDSGQMIASYLEVTPSNPQVHFPHLFVIDKNGIIKNDFDGTDDKFLTTEALSAEIDKLK
jgi:peroxiredoxin